MTESKHRADDGHQTPSPGIITDVLPTSDDEEPVCMYLPPDRCDYPPCHYIDCPLYPDGVQPPDGIPARG